MIIVGCNDYSITIRENDKVGNIYIQRITEKGIEIMYMGERFNYAGMDDMTISHFMLYS